MSVANPFAVACCPCRKTTSLESMGNCGRLDEARFSEDVEDIPLVIVVAGAAVAALTIVAASLRGRAGGGGSIHCCCCCCCCRTGYSCCTCWNSCSCCIRRMYRAASVSTLVLVPFGNVTPPRANRYCSSSILPAIRILLSFSLALRYFLQAF